jgi:RNA recognition motif-containing protein
MFDAANGCREERCSIMPSKLYVGNLPFEVSDDDLQELFAAHGAVVSAKVITDRETGRARGFGFVEMEQAEDAQKAIQSLDGQDFKGRNLKVNMAKPREDRSGGGGGGRW